MASPASVHSTSLESTCHASLPGAVLAKLRLIRKRKLIVQLASAIVAATAVLLAAMAVAMLVDWLVTLYDSRWRVVLTICAISAFIMTLLGWMIVAWRQYRRLDNAASEVDRRHPQLQERWTTLTRLRAEDTANPRIVHPAMHRKVADEASNWEPNVQADEVVSLSILARSMIGLSAIAAVLIVAAAFDLGRVSVLARRFWSPSASISATDLIAISSETVVGRGEPLELKTAIGGVAVDRGMLFLRPQGAEPQAIALIAHGEEPRTLSYRIRSVEEPFAYRFRAGDGQSGWFHVGVADRPEIADHTLTVTPLSYTGREPSSYDRLPRRLSAMAMSRLELAVKPKQPVELVELEFGPEKRVAMKRAEDGWYRWEHELTQSLNLSLRLTESHGLTNRRPPHSQIEVYPDRPPVVKVITPDGDVAVRPDDVIDIAFSARDDVGIAAAELVVYDESAGGESVPLEVIPIDLGAQAGARTIQETVVLDLARYRVQDGVKLSYEIRVREYRGQSPSGGAMASTGTPEGDSSTATAGADAAPMNASGAGAPGAAQAENASPGMGATGELAGVRQTPTPRATAEDMAALAVSNQPAGDDMRPPVESMAGTSAPASGATSLGANSGTASSDVNTTAAVGAPSGAAPASGVQEQLTAGDTSAVPSAKDSSDAVDSAGSSRNASTGDMAGSDDERVASSGRQGLAAIVATGGGAEPVSGAGDPGSPGSSPTASTSSGASGNGSPSGSDSPPPDSMVRRMLDVPAQSACSNRMTIKVDQWAGSYDDQLREKLEMAIAPELAFLDEALSKAQLIVEGVLREVSAPAEWREVHDREVAGAEKSIIAARKLIDSLEERSADTPYAFVGLQVKDIGVAHVNPARKKLWTAVQSGSDERLGLVRDANQHLTRARELLKALQGQFDAARREFHLASLTQRVKTMYQVYVENAQALLDTSPSDPSRYNRQIAEFELDEEFLERLREVLAMRNELRAELARILADDPRLLRRFMDRARAQAHNLREQLATLAADQENLNREVSAWAMVEEAQRDQMAELLLIRHMQRAAEISADVAELSERYEAWAPLGRTVDDAALSPARDAIERLASMTNELNRNMHQYVSDLRRITIVDPEADDRQTDSAATSDQLAALASVGKNVYDQLLETEVAIRQLAVNRDEELSTFAGNRLVETRRLVIDLSAWLRQLHAHQAGHYHRAAEVDQYRLATQTDELAGKLGDIEPTLVALMQRNDGQLPEPIAARSREFLSALDQKAVPNQLSAVYSLRSAQLPQARVRQTAASAALDRAEEAYDEMIRLALAEIDTLPVQDPTAADLQEPTLDELLSLLEQELPLAELLGIPCRPTNLNIVNDWMRPNMGMPGGGNLVRQQMHNMNRRNRMRLDDAYRRAIARALNETTPRRIEEPMNVELSDWNRLRSKLDDELGQGRETAPPERYRRAIERYFAEISRAAAENDQGGNAN